MPDFTAPTLPDDVAHPTGLLDTLLTMSLTAVAVLQPLYDEHAEEIRDFAWVRLNPAGQQMLGQPERPPATLLTLFPTAKEDGVFEVCRQAFKTGELKRYQTYYQADGLDGYFLLIAQRYADLLVVNFTDTNDRPRTDVEEALRQSQAREQAARAEAELRRGELQRVFEQAPTAIAVYRGPNYTIELANPTVARLWGRTQEQLIGKGLFEALPEVAGMGYEQLLDEVMATGNPHVAHAMEAQHDRNGQRETVYWDFVYVPTYAADGHIDGAMVVANEVTEQVRARQRLEQLNQELEARVQERTQALATQQALLGQILQQVPACIATLSGPNHQYTFFNEPYQRLSANRTVLGKTVAEVFPEVVEQGFIELLDGVYSSGEPFISRDMPAQLYDVATGQPELSYIDLIYQPLFNDAQQVHGILAFAIDVTEKVQSRRQAEMLQEAMLAATQRQVQEREALYQIFEQTPAAISLTSGPDHHYIYLNTACQTLFAGRELLGRTVAEALPEASSQGLLALIDQVYQTGETYFGTDQLLFFNGPDDTVGHSRYYDFTYQAYRENGNIVGICTFAFDVTEQFQVRAQVQQLNEELAAINEELLATNEELLDTNNQLQRTNRDLDTFVYAASHDLKSPIANIEGLLNALRDYLPTEVQEPMVPRLVGMMEGSIARFQQTVAHLTDVSRLQQGAEELSPEGLDIAQVLENVRLDLLPLIESTNADVRIAVEACSNIRFSTKNMRSVLFNLLSNALKYRTPDRPPQVHVRSHCSDTHLLLEVADNGLGLSEKQQSQLFIMFRRLHTHVEGSGVGLYLIKRMIENAGGSITVQSQLGVGSTFTVSLPRRPEALSARSSPLNQ
ncbi:PAS domain-containing protein [Hymenobacter sp. BT186]|uniref:histidine kinase n=1 Tax=Hymenobacter telluris TaxID=2816474 RepID=A0A939EXT7_9BACT|nr:PAS domain-containing protein [Hymenobacter telluris]MBO0358565.1 PAS domain-containing protein [Hymenobacter telluris]MBW3374591.1 PAS domain-containing protein [Hymenobacter norwichensis]